MNLLILSFAWSKLLLSPSSEFSNYHVSFRIFVFFTVSLCQYSHFVNESLFFYLAVYLCFPLTH